LGMVSRLSRLWIVLAVMVGLAPGMAVWEYTATAAPASVRGHHHRHQRRRHRRHRRRHHRRHHHHHRRRHHNAQRATASRALGGGHHQKGGGTTTTTTSTTSTSPSTSTTTTSATTTTTSTSTTTTTATTSNSTLVWSDEFNGSAGSLPDPTKWQIISSPSGLHHNELECYTNDPSNVGLDGQGHLAITALAGSGSCPYTSGRLQTNGLFQTQYGELKASIQLPAGQGLWPAFWAMGDDRYTVDWPQCGEIDMMENLGSDPFKVYGSVHGPDGSASGYGYTTSYRSPVSLASGFHTFAVEWTPTSIAYSLDGVTYATYTPSTLSAGQTWVFNHPFFLLLDLAVGGDWPGAPNSSTQFPAKMVVDWVRVYS
jgi:beta-glucanase (GH16 family)